MHRIIKVSICFLWICLGCKKVEREYTAKEGSDSLTGTIGGLTGSYAIKPGERAMSKAEEIGKKHNEEVNEILNREF